MPKYKKKPIVIEAFQMTVEILSNPDELPKWFLEAFQLDELQVGSVKVIHGGVNIVTLEGKHRASYDDYIIQGIKGELYPCKPDIFEATYDQVGEHNEKQ